MPTPTSLGNIITDWMSHADACTDCPNTQPPRAAIPSARAGWFVASYECADCGNSWTREYFTKEYGLV